MGTRDDRNGHEFPTRILDQGDYKSGGHRTVEEATVVRLFSKNLCSRVAPPVR